MKAFNIDNLCNECEPFETDKIEKCDKPNCMYKTQTVWDDKFGIIEGRVVDGKCGYTKVIDGVGKDAEIVENQMGGKQSKSPMAMHLVDPQFLNDWFNTSNALFPMKDEVIRDITDYMKTGDKTNLINAIFECNCILNHDDDENLAIVEIAKVLQYGADKYEANNWRLIPQEQHINHALIHYLAFILGDTQDEHLEHCMCRLMMAYATQKSPDFNYTKYVPKGINRIQD